MFMLLVFRIHSSCVYSLRIESSATHDKEKHLTDNCEKCVEKVSPDKLVGQVSPSLVGEGFLEYG